MRILTAGDIVGLHYVRVEAEMRLADVRDRIRSLRASHAAVFEGDVLLGIVPLHACHIVSPSRIFADLLPHEPASEVNERCSLDEVGVALERGVGDAVVVRSDDGRFLGIVTQQELAKTLLAESKRTIREIAKLQGQQERLRILGQMVSGIAHNLTNSLVPLQWGLSNLRGDAVAPVRLVESVALASTAADDIASLVGRLRDFYHEPPEAAADELVNVPALLSAVRDLTAPKWRDQARARGVLVDVAVQVGDVPLVRGRASELREVLINLVVNAVDALDRDGTVTLRASRSRDDVVVEVRDTGVGMTELQKRSCLTPFFTTKGEEGTGLGLSVSAEVVERHGGSIAVESAEGRGTTVRVTLPLSANRASDVPPTKGQRVLRALYVDDDSTKRPVIEQILCEHGVSVDFADGGRSGLARLEKQDYDAVITDFAMPDMDGLAVTRAVKTRNPSTPVVLLTEWDARDVGQVLDVNERPDAVMARHDVTESLGRFVAQALRSTTLENQGAAKAVDRAEDRGR